MAKPKTVRASAKIPVLATQATSTSAGKSAKGLRYRAVEIKVGYTERHIRRLVRRGEFPAPNKVDGGATLAWTAESIEAWLASKAVA